MRIFLKVPLVVAPGSAPPYCDSTWTWQTRSHAVKTHKSPARATEKGVLTSRVISATLPRSRSKASTSATVFAGSRFNSWSISGSARPEILWLNETWSKDNVRWKVSETTKEQRPQHFRPFHRRLVTKAKLVMKKLKIWKYDITRRLTEMSSNATAFPWIRLAKILVSTVQRV